MPVADERGRIVSRMIQEFREFATRGNIVMVAVGFIMGLAFQGVVNSLVENVIMPIVSIPFGQPNFDQLTWQVNESVIMYGSFLTAAVTFLLTAFAVFLFIVKPYNAFSEALSPQEEEEEVEAGPTEIELLAEIRDQLRRA